MNRGIHQVLIGVAIPGWLLSSCSMDSALCDSGLAKSRCQKKSDNGVVDVDQSGGGGAGGGHRTRTGNELQTEEVTEILPGNSFALHRITPESMSANKEIALNYRTFYTDENSGQDHDYIVGALGVGLGGVDYRTVLKRDPRTKAQTLLIARLFAWSVARDSVGTEWGRSESQRLVFTKCNLESDRPQLPGDSQLSAPLVLAARQSEDRWTEQVRELFWRLYSRPPTNDEITAVRAAFVAAYNEQNVAPYAWMVVIYAMLAAEEYWHI